MHMSHQLSPVPDYSGHEDLQPVQITCRDCGDTELQFVALNEVADRIRRQRCDECQDEHVSEVAIAKRTVAVNREAILRSVLAPLETRSRTDERSILCDECGEEVGTYVGFVDHLDGKAMQCTHCKTFGKVVVGDDEGLATVKFRGYTARELAVRELPL